jgi:hypothetical protein
VYSTPDFLAKPSRDTKFNFESKIGYLISQASLFSTGGGGGIRTHVRQKKAKAVFKTATISHSVTPPDSKFYFKATSSGNLADRVPASLLDFDSTWIIYKLPGQGITGA